MVALSFEGPRVSVDKTAAEASRVRFGDDGVEPSRRRLYAAQELMWEMRTASVFAAAFACPHRCLH